MKDYLLRARFDVRVRTPQMEVIRKQMTYEEANQLTIEILERYPHDDVLQRQLRACMGSFGFRGFGIAGYDINISAYLPLVKTGEVHSCPRRMKEFGTWEKHEGMDSWDLRGEDRICSFCGSLHPLRVVDLLTQHGMGILETSTNSYKWYIRRPEVPNAYFGGIKYYRQHDTPEFLAAIKTFGAE